MNGAKKVSHVVTTREMIDEVTRRVDAACPPMTDRRVKAEIVFEILKKIEKMNRKHAKSEKLT